MADHTDARNSRPKPAVRTFLAALADLRRQIGRRLWHQRWSFFALVLVLTFVLAAAPVEFIDLIVALVLFALVVVAVPGGMAVSRTASDVAETTDRVFAETLSRVGEAVGLSWAILDERGLVRQLNALAARQFPTLEPGVPISMSLRNPALISAIDTCRRTGSSQTVEMQQTVPNQVWQRVHVALLVPPRDEAAPRKWMVVTFTDITELRRIDAMRADFIANASHELRTPLTSVVGFIETLRGPAAHDTKARENFLGIMANQAARMSRLIDDLMSLSRIESRQHLPPSGTVDLKSIIEEVVEAFAPRAAEAGVVIARDVPPSAVVVPGDRIELHEIFENLVDNALKYGAEGGRIEVSLKPANGRPGYAYAVTVTDHGPGIPAEHVPRLTERFYRVDAESSRKKKGTGLGLAIVKHIVSRHRGLLTIRSELGQGTSVEVLLPS